MVKQAEDKSKKSSVKDKVRKRAIGIRSEGQTKPTNQVSRAEKVEPRSKQTIDYLHPSKADLDAIAAKHPDTIFRLWNAEDRQALIAIYKELGLKDLSDKDLTYDNLYVGINPYLLERGILRSLGLYCVTSIEEGQNFTVYGGTTHEVSEDENAYTWGLQDGTSFDGLGGTLTPGIIINDGPPNAEIRLPERAGRFGKSIKAKTVAIKTLSANLQVLWSYGKTKKSICGKDESDDVAEQGIVKLAETDPCLPFDVLAQESSTYKKISFAEFERRMANDVMLPDEMRELLQQDGLYVPSDLWRVLTNPRNKTLITDPHVLNLPILVNAQGRFKHVMHQNLFIKLFDGYAEQAAQIKKSCLRKPEDFQGRTVAVYRPPVLAMSPKPVFGGLSGRRGQRVRKQTSKGMGYQREKDFSKRPEMLADIEKQDVHGDMLIHHLVRLAKVEHIKSILGLSKDAPEEKSYALANLLNLVNNDGYDFYTYAISQGNVAVVRMMKPLVHDTYKALTKGVEYTDETKTIPEALEVCPKENIAEMRKALGLKPLKGQSTVGVVASTLGKRAKKEDGAMDAPKEIKEQPKQRPRKDSAVSVNRSPASTTKGRASSPESRTRRGGNSSSRRCLVM